MTTKAILGCGFVSIEMTRYTGDGEGNLILDFNADKSHLMSWIFIEGIGVKTTVSFHNPVYDIRLENKLFGVPSHEPEKNN